MDAPNPSNPERQTSQTIDEVYLVQNPALGAILMWKFVEGYKRASGGKLPLMPLLFLVLPVIFNESLRSVLDKTFLTSGMRLFVAKFSQRQETLLAIQRRMLMLRSTSLSSLSIAIEGGLLALDHSNALVDFSSKPFPRGTREGIRSLAKQADKLGAWCSSLTIQEVQTALRIGF
ncbi:hypothetical protein FQ192_31040 [Pseudomonas sp. ANT_J12]|uniref:Uncharacterized protein n=1 Tax=Pseudomonas prosekii TaxID=1148509 RepID=A0A2U2D0C5_9PSED|nr:MULTISPECIES: three component ABC system middle component [Pseudomonas]KAA0982641.1 hypothetical protein FQ192_31040 [Pseudomonas sp. ANT_J12]PWE38778.1 hypothetical protein C9I49_27440 [Pseudomonas prosekii]